MFPLGNNLLVIVFASEDSGKAGHRERIGADSLYSLGQYYRQRICPSFTGLFELGVYIPSSAQLRPQRRSADRYPPLTDAARRFAV